MHAAKRRNPFRFIRHLWRNRIGWCNICGLPSIFIYTNRYDRMRELAECPFCRSTARNRHVALCMVDAYQEKGIRTIRDFGRNSGFSVYITSVHGAIARFLGNAANIHKSEYFEGVPSGLVVKGIQNQDLQSLSFDDETMDLVVTEDVFEHVRNYHKGFLEVYRVLKKGGYHIFSVPFYFSSKTRELFGERDGAFVPVIQPIEYHGDHAHNLIPAFYRYGYDLLEKLFGIGFSTEIIFSTFNDFRVSAIFGCYTFLSRKHS